MTDAQDVLVVVRSGGERTESACVACAAAQVGAEQVVLLREPRFSLAVARGFEVALARRPRWYITLDADCLLRTGALHELIQLAEAGDERVYHTQGLMLDRTFGGPTLRALHCFRGSLLEEASALVNADPATLKPETAVLRAMERRGYLGADHGVVLGVHEYEQSYRHLYLKMLLRARKDDQARDLLRRLRARAEAGSRESADDLVSSWGVEDGLRDRQGPREYDWSAELPALDARLHRAGLGEKPPLPEGFGPGFADRVIERYQPEADSLIFPWFAWSGDPLRWRRVA